MPPNTDFPAVFAQLKAILRRCEPHLKVQTDEPDHYSLWTPYCEKYRKPLFFGAVRIGKSYVSYHLIPVYACPDVLDALSPELRRRMQGKSCFNFRTTLSDEQHEELARLTQRGLERFKSLFPRGELEPKNPDPPLSR
jgi:hypothetical protein